jgi:hypothetical protein
MTDTPTPEVEVATPEQPEQVVKQLRNVPAQPRSSSRLQSILSAAEEVYAEVGRDKFTTGAVAERVGCSIGTIYRYFKDRIALLDALDPDRDQSVAVTPAPTPTAVQFLEAKDPDEKLLSALKTIRTWGQNLVDKGEGKQQDLAKIGQSLIKILDDRNV